MGKLSASLVVDITDKTGGKTKAIIGNMNRLQRAERDLALADRGAQLSRRDRALERVMIERETSIEERRQRVAMWAARGGAALAVAGVAAGKAYMNFADVERRINRIVLNADKGVESIRPTMATLQTVAAETRMSFADATEGLETLVASGRSLEDALGFLPAVAVTAQASGAAISDVALSADSMAGSMQIGAAEMQRAFDILVSGGKAGKFELRDMSQYLPSLLPAFAALGYKGTEGLQKIVAILQVMRNQAGSSGEAATYLGNVLNKMYSEETSNKFKKFGIDIRKELDLAKASGKDLIDVFVEMAGKATKGDLAKLPMIFTDSELQKGMRALITQRPELEKLFKELGNVDGTALRDVNQIFEDSASKIQKMSNLWSKFQTQIGSGVATVANPALEAVTDAIDDNAAGALGKKQFRDDLDYNNHAREFRRRYREINPEAWFFQVNEALAQALAAVGRGQAKTIFDGLILDEGRRAGGQIAARYPGRGSYDQDSAQTGSEDLPVSRPKASMPVPESRPDRQEPLAVGAGYPSPGSYEPGSVPYDGALRPDQKGTLGDVEALAARAIKTDRAREARGRSGFEWLFDQEFWLGKAAKGGSLREHMGFDVTGGALSQPADASVAANGATSVAAASDGVSGASDAVSPQPSSPDRRLQEVSLLGMPTVISQPSGVQLVQVTNLPVTPSPAGASDAGGERLDPRWFYDAGSWPDRSSQRWQEDPAPQPRALVTIDVGDVSVPSGNVPVSAPRGGPEQGAVSASVPGVASVQDVQVTNFPALAPATPPRRNGAGHDLMLDRGYWPGRDPAPPSDDGDKRAEPGPASSTPERQTVAEPGPQEVSLLGTPTVIAQPSGVQQVQVMNPPPAPQINIGGVTVYATSNASPQEIGNQAANAISQRVKAALSGVHADTEYSVG